MDVLQPGSPASTDSWVKAKNFRSSASNLCCILGLKQAQRPLSSNSILRDSAASGRNQTVDPTL